ncbi:MAG: glycosyltransferase [Hyphomicrobiales bacterium]|nr:MAG: glycosyltransferase [Hyphomicrobiales bacterium]
MRVLIVLPRNMRYGEVGATSIDLTVRDLVEHRPDWVQCTIAAAHSGETFAGHEVVRIAETSTRKKVKDVVALLRTEPYDVVVVQQHLPTAAKLARVTDIPVILHTHNFQKSAQRSGIFPSLRRQFRLSRYQSLAGLIHVSEACHAHFRKHWPEFEGLQTVVYNGLDMCAWQPQVRREEVILCTARNVAEKGVLPAAEATREVLNLRQDWRAIFILSETVPGDDYAQATLATLRGHKRISVLLDQPHAVVKKAYESSAIAIVPSVWDEPFGRTALEGHAGGCSVVSSSSGGLAEVSGGHALKLRSVTKESIVEALLSLIDGSALRSSLANRGRLFVERNFDIVSVSQHFADFCRAVASSNQAKRGH